MVQIDAKARPLGGDRLPWTDRFSKPNLKQLRSHYDAAATNLFDEARRSVAEQDDVSQPSLPHTRGTRRCGARGMS